jgi:hypothetical protein
MVKFVLEVTIMAHDGETDEEVRRRLVDNVYDTADVDDVEVLGD